ncbi:MAG TPA: Na(+)/H(+) antiporter subunit A, partial [Desulfobacteraceae bacterium]|nr:Na(+)/H(+) antiporter subunit A [Desulfobacteraceae bacterium]
MTDTYLILPVLFVFTGALAAPVFGRINLEPRVAGLVLSLFPLAAFLFILTRLPALEPDMAYVWQYPWMPGIWFSFYMDSLAAFFALLVTFI